MFRNLFFFTLCGFLINTAYADTFIPYMRINASHETYSDKVELNSNSSQAGVKGSVDIDKNFSIIYQAELQFDASGHDLKTFKQRKVFLGVKTKIGNLFAGTYNTPTKALDTSLDAFNTMTGDIKSLFVGETREDNQISYLSPTFFHTKIEASLIHQNQNDLLDHEAYSYSVKFNKSGIFLGFAQSINMYSESVIADYLDIKRFAYSYKFNKTRIGGFFQRSSEGADATQKYQRRSWQINLQHRINTTWGTRLQHQKGHDLLNHEKGSQTSFAIDLFFKNRHKVYMFTSLKRGEIFHEKRNINQSGIGIEINI